MNESNSPQTADLSRFEFWVGELIETCEQLKQENISLRQEQASLVDENNRLLGRNSRVSQRLETLIGRLKRMEIV